MRLKIVLLAPLLVCADSLKLPPLRHAVQHADDSFYDFAAARQVQSHPPHNKYQLMLGNINDSAKSELHQLHDKDAFVKINTPKGRSYECFLIDSKENENDAANFFAYNSVSSRTIHHTLAALGDECLKYNDGIWDYEFCPRRHVKQRRTLAIGSKQYEEEYLLGRFIPANPGSSHDDSEIFHVKGYLRQTYFDGDFCELNGSQRETQIRFNCKPGSGKHLLPKITDVVELSLCRYVVYVSMPELCSVQKQQLDVTPITCLSSHELMSYSEEDELKGAVNRAEADLVDLRKTVWAQRLQAILDGTESNYPLVQKALQNLVRHDDAADAKPSTFNFLKWIQMMGLEAENLLVSLAPTKKDEARPPEEDKERDDRREHK